MFQRLKGAIDSRIAEEQAKLQQSQPSPSNADSGTRRATSRTDSPNRRTPKPPPRARQDGDPGVKGPDPSSFEPDFVIEDGELSRSGTPAPMDVGSVADGKDGQKIPSSEPAREAQDEATTTGSPRASHDIPTDVRVKLRKLEKLGTRYQDLLRSYRVAHARVLTIEPFETSLRENTPLTSIGDPNALVEYLNQVNLKGDMVLDELKRVSSERDTFKQRLIEAENSTRAAWDEVADLRKEKPSQGKPEVLEEQVNGSRSTNEDEQKEPSHSPKSPTTSIKSIKSPTLSLPGMSMFSPKPKAMELPQARQGSEDLFSYDGEVPRLETELEAKDKKIQCLETDVMSLKTDLAVTRESTQSMVQTLEEATREVNALRESRDRADLDAKEQQSSLQKLSERLRADLQAAEEKVQQLEAVRSSQDAAKFEELSTRLQDARQELERLQSVNLLNQKKEGYAEGLHKTINTLEGDLSSARKECQQHEKKAETLNSLITNLRSQLANAESKNEEITSEIESSSAKIGTLKQQIEELNSNREAADQVVQLQGTSSSSGQPPQPANPEVGGIPDVASTNKKKNKKKKKGAKSGPEQDRDQNESKEEMAVEHSTGPTDSGIIERLQQDLKNLQNLLEEKDAAIDKAHAKLTNQDVLREEIDLLRDNLVDVGQEHVETKDKVKELVAEKNALETTVTSLEEELANLRGAHESTTAESEQRHRDLAAQFEDLKVKATSLQTDLSAAQQLASTRFKDLNDLRSILQKAQPEINSLRTEAAAMKSTQEALGKKEIEFKRLDSRHEEMRSDVTKLKQTIAARETEIKTLKHTASQEMSARSKAEEANSKAQQDMGRVEAETRQATESLEKLSRELNKSREQLASHKAQLKEVEQQFSKHRSDSEGLKEEIDLKSAQYASAQSLMASMRDQTAEMAIQMKEARDRCDSLDEEVADAHRLLSERSREGETMRRLLVDVEGRADARTREMKERMDSAIEERDRAEEEASTAGRRRARELEDIRSRYHDVERSLKRAEDDKEELEVAQRDWKKRREELEHRASHSSSEVDEVRKAMSELRDALDESEKQARDLEKQKAELRRSVEETQHRLEKLQKSNKAMADEIGKVQVARSKAVESEGQSSRSSLDSTARLGSPAPKSRVPSAAMIDPPNGQKAGTMDYVYLKNVLLQFLEQRDKKHQMQLIPVLGMLLHFDGKDEQKWMSAINTKA